MNVNLERTQALLARPVLPAAGDELRRDGEVFFVGAQLAPYQAVESILESDGRSPAELFVFRFAEPADFAGAEALIRAIKRNFKGFLVGQFLTAPSPHQLEHAYAAGIDYIDIPRFGEQEQSRDALLCAKAIFPRWSVISTLFAGIQPLTAICKDIDALLGLDILPLGAVDRAAARCPARDVAEFFEHLAAGWRRERVPVKPLHPLLRLTTPLALPPAKRGMQGLFDKVDGARLRTSSDLRRLLRVREVEESFASAGL